MSGFGAFTADDSINLLPEVAKLVNNKLISFDHLSALLLFHSFTRADLSGHFVVPVTAALHPSLFHAGRSLNAF